MNNYNIPLPKVTNGTPENKLNEIQRYLFQLVDELNWILGTKDGDTKEAKSEPVNTDEIVAEVKTIIKREFDDIYTTLREYRSIGLVANDGMLCAIYNEEVGQNE